jgi:hypothetical protein
LMKMSTFLGLGNTSRLDTRPELAILEHVSGSKRLVAVA